MKQNYQPSLKINFLLNTLYEILCIITPLISAPYANNYIIKCNKKETPYVFLLSGAWGHKKEKHLRTTISEFTKVKFEDDEFTAPKNYDIFLQNNMEITFSYQKILKVVIINIDVLN